MKTGKETGGYHSLGKEPTVSKKNWLDAEISWADRASEAAKKEPTIANYCIASKAVAAVRHISPLYQALYERHEAMIRRLSVVGSSK